MAQSPSITIISGSPGTGKSTLARSLAQHWHEQGAAAVLLPSDVFYTFPMKPLAPQSPGAKAQNQTIARAIAASAAHFVDGGYHVVVDGVVGPWMLPHYLKPLQGRGDQINYVILRAPLEETLQRASLRPEADKISIDDVRALHRQFSNLNVFEPHVLETGGKTTGQSRVDLTNILKTGRLRIQVT